MQQMAQSFKDLAASFSTPADDRVGTLPPEAEAMRAAAINWSRVCLEEFRDDLLRKGLLMSAAIADFLAELEGTTRRV